MFDLLALLLALQTSISRLESSVTGGHQHTANMAAVFMLNCVSFLDLQVNSESHLTVPQESCWTELNAEQ